MNDNSTINQSNGNLNLSIVKVNSPYNCNGTNVYYKTGDITSKNKFKHGIYECSATFSYKHGAFPAFWTISSENCEYSINQEIDIVEMKCEESNPSNVTLDNNVFGYYTPCNTGRWSPEMKRNPDFNWSGAHTYKVIWTNEKLEYFADNNKMHEYTNSGGFWYPTFDQHVKLSQQATKYNNNSPYYGIDLPSTAVYHEVKVREFFLAPVINIPDLICNNSAQVVLDVDSRATSIQWNVQPTGFFTSATSSGTGKIANLTRDNYSNGLATITYSFNMPSGESFTANQTFWVGKPNVLKVTYEDGSNVPTNNYGEPTACPNTNYKFSVYSNMQPCYASNTIWDVPVEWSINYTNGNEISINTNSSPYNCIYADALDCCGSNINISLCLENSSSCGYYYMSINPNPANGETTISILSKDNKYPVDETLEWDLNVFDQGMLLMVKAAKLKGKQTKINTNGWKEGVYYIKIKYKNEQISAKLAVNK